MPGEEVGTSATFDEVSHQSLWGLEQHSLQRAERQGQRGQVFASGGPPGPF
jgi:hypothetical protein